MRIEVAKHDRMSETGKSLLRLIQNNNMPILDLLVRESVQNSLDAALEGEGFVQVDFNIRTFKKSQLTAHFEGIQEQLSLMYPDEEYRLLEIRDSNTHGLTGPLHESECKADEYGNLIKLIYQIGMPQQKEGSGGSWGLGKTVYFRLGAGLVIYYSRILENGRYASRLAACLVEDESREDALLKQFENNRGIAWWGQEAPGGTTMPLTEEREILEILEVLGCKPFEGDQTGTVIIIPFLRDDLRPVYLDEDGESGYLPPWCRSDEEYITVALQRWYAPRLMNPCYPYGRWLRATVNGQGITRDRFLPIFGKLQDLYNHALKRGGFSRDVQGTGEKNEIEYPCFEVRLNNTFKNSSVAGWVCFHKFNRSDLLMEPPYNNPSPWVQIFGREMSFENNPAIISFTRKPGMVVGYEHTGKWVEGIPRTQGDEYLVGIFVANSNNPLLEGPAGMQGKDYLLEEYIRGCEKADHASWIDWTLKGKNPLIIDRIQKNLTRQVARAFSDKSTEKNEKKITKWGRLLASVLLPPQGFGKDPSVASKPDSRTESGGIGGSNPKFIGISSPKFENEMILVHYELYTGKTGMPFNISLKVLTEAGAIDGDSWEGDQGIGSRFPVTISRMIINSISAPKSSVNECKQDIVIDSPEKIVYWNDICFAGRKSRVFRQFCGIAIQGADRIVKGSFWIKPEDRNIRAILSIDSQAGDVRS